MPEQFHFLQPLWLLGLIPLALLVWRLRQATASDNPWTRIIDSRLHALLLVGQDHKVSRSLLWLLGSGWLLASLALANPTWEKQPQPLYQTSTARVIVLDLSLSMLDRDLKPSRLARARFKIEDVLSRNDEGQTGLVVFAGDAFTVTPLTRDMDTIRALLKSLDPGLMPVQGSRADLGLKKAGELLRQAGLSNGQILLLADGVVGNKARKAATQLRKQGYRVSVLGVGTAKAEPLTNAEGQLLRIRGGKLIVPQLEITALQDVAAAGGGHYRSFSNSDTDINTLLANRTTLNSKNLVSGDTQGQDWKDFGPWLAVLLLPLAALSFRRGWLMSVVLLVSIVPTPQQAMAANWDDLWQRPDQQAVEALHEKNYERASQIAQDPLLRGSAEYRRGNYPQALQDFSKAEGATADYNKGNVLAKIGRYKDAISAYDSALKSTPGMEDALANKAAIEALLRQQKKQSQGKQNQKGKQGQQSKQDQKSKQGQQSKQDQKGKQGQQSKQAQKGKQGQQNKQAQKGKQDQKDKAQQKNAGTSKNQFADASKALEKKKASKKPAANKPAAGRITSAIKRTPGRRQHSNHRKPVVSRAAQNHSAVKSRWQPNNGCGVSRTTPVVCCGASSCISTSSGHNVRGLAAASPGK